MSKDSDEIEELIRISKQLIATSEALQKEAKLLSDRAEHLREKRQKNRREDPNEAAARIARDGTEN
jgi:hypothetical protein